MRNFVRHVLQNGGSIHPLIIPPEVTNGTGIFNPCVYNDNGKLIMNLRHCQVTIYHSEKGIFEHEWGPLIYLNPENDITLTTSNYFCTLDKDFHIESFHKIDFSKLDGPSIWEFKGLEDGRLFRWNGKLYICGVRRDTTTNGQGRMELCELDVREDGVSEISRFRIPAPEIDNTYCEKNWMPIVDWPYHYVKWTNPTQVVRVDPDNKTCESVFVRNWANFTGHRDLRGSSQALPFKDGHFCLTHEVDLFKSQAGRKDCVYRHRFVFWDKDWNIVKASHEVSFLDVAIEFCCGMTEYGDDYLITFGVCDNAAYLLRCPKTVIENMFNA